MSEDKPEKKPSPGRKPPIDVTGHVEFGAKSTGMVYRGDQRGNGKDVLYGTERRRKPRGDKDS